MDKKNLWIIAALVLVVAAVALLSTLLPKGRTALPAVLVTDPGGLVTTIAPEPAPEETAPAPEPKADPQTGGQTGNDGTAGSAEPRGWLLVTVDNRTYKPYPLTKTGDYTINQKRKKAVNVIHVTEDSIQMASSTCDNQNCVGEGIVTLENKADRILGNYIVCLPNGVTLELLNAQEYKELTEGKRE